MKRTLLCASIALTGIGAFAQCTPNALYADSVFGVWPDTTENFVDGEVGVFYSDTLNLIVPLNAQDVDPGLPDLDLDSVQLDAINGLPPGLAVACNSQTPAPCTFLTGVLGCGLIEGTPTTAGTYPITLDVIAYTVIFGSPAGIPQSFSGYQIVIAPSTVGVHELAGPALSGVRNIPNPFSGRTSIEFDLARAGAVRLAVYNLVGEEMWNTVQNGTTGTNKVIFDGSELGEGVYLYKVEADGGNFTGRMVLHR